MLDSNTPLEKIAEMCNSMENLHKLLKQCSLEETEADNIPISPELLQEAISKTEHLKTVTRAELQKQLGIGYPKAAKLYELIANLKNDEK